MREAIMPTAHPHIRILSEAQLDQIEETAFRLLEEVGISLQHGRATEMLHGLGCRVRDDRVLIPRDVVNWGLANVDRSVVIRSADGSREAALGQGGVLTHNGGGDPNVFDIHTGKRRPAVLQDLADATRLLDALPNVDVVVPLVGPQDVPEGLMTVASFEVLLHHTRKPITGAAAETAADVCYMVELAAACCGGTDAFRKRPTISLMVSPISPLTFSEKVTGAIIAVAESGAPFDSLPAPSMGATGPITMAGIVAQQHAEVLASLVILAAARPGAPITYCSRINPIDMRSAVSSWGGPEVGIAGAWATQLAHRHGLKCDAYGLCTSASTIDPQFAYEKLANALIPALAGADILSGVAAMDSGLTASLEGAVIDDEMVGLMRYILRGYEVNEETLAYDVMKEVIPAQGSFLAELHTVEHLRSGGVWIPDISDRAMGTEDDPHVSVADRARERALEILKTHEVAPLPDEVNRHLSEIMERARRELVTA
jgi:trimethylamine--corrinoid protein Co-methyltransferase